jgi:hypothetical protein
MTSRPIYRWKSFWLGLFVACFFAWAWWDSMENRMLLVIGQGRLGILVERHAGVTRVVGNWPVKYPGVEFHHYNRGREATDTESICASLGLRYSKVRDSRVLLYYLAVWSAFLGWRRWRMKRLAAGMAEEPDRGSI